MQGLLKKIHETEVEYVKKFSEYYEDNDVIKFWDDSLANMYTHNFILIKKGYDIGNIKEIILNELIKRKKEGLDFLRVEFNFTIDNCMFNNFAIKPDVTKYDYMYIKPDMSKFLMKKQNCIIKKAISEKVLQDGIEVDILANESDIEKDFVRKRIYRKTEVYKRTASNLDLYVCYNGEIPVGNCEMMLNNDIAKIEDFDILKEHQRRGFGTSVMKYLLEQANNQGIEIVYLITDSKDTAKEMYKKCGFKKAGKKTELFFDLNK